jgi:hypothetical protein
LVNGVAVVLLVDVASDYAKGSLDDQCHSDGNQRNIESIKKHLCLAGGFERVWAVWPFG